MYLRMNISNTWLTTCLYKHTSEIAILMKCRHVHVLFYFTVIVATNEAYLVGLSPLSAAALSIPYLERIIEGACIDLGVPHRIHGRLPSYFLTNCVYWNLHRQGTSTQLNFHFQR